MSDACPHDFEKVECSPLNQKRVIRVEISIEEDWKIWPYRTATFQAFLDSLEMNAVRSAIVKPARPVFGNYATKR